MALPTTITGISTAVACVGPFKSSGGNYYFIGRSSADANKLRAMKATDPTVSFSAAGTDPATTGVINAQNIAAYPVGDVVHVAIAESNGGAGAVNFSYYAFDMSSDSWTVTGEAIQAGVSTSTSASIAVYGCSIVVRSDGHVVVVYNGPRVANMGNSYSRIVAKRRTGTNTWVAADGVTNPTPLDAGGQVDYVAPKAVLGSSDRTHFFWYSSTGNAGAHRALTSANALQTANTSGPGLFSGGFISGLSYDVSGTQKLLAYFPSSNSQRVWYGDSANTPTLSLATPTATDQLGRLFHDDGIAYQVTRASDSDLYIQSSSDHGATWGSQTNIFTATISATEANLSVDGAVYQRGSDFVIPYVVNDNGTLKYNEYVVRSTSSNKTLAAGGGSYTLTGTAATPKIARKVVAAAGSYAITGTAATLRRNLPMVAGVGSYSLTGTAATLRHAWKLTAAAGSYAITGTDAAVKKGQTLAAGAGSYALTGTAASLLHNWKLAAAAGSYALTGTAATLRRNLPLIAGAGSYAITGTAASVFHAWKVSAGGGSYALTGTAASLLHAWKVSAGTGSYAIIGSDATLTIAVGASNKTLGADAGSYSITGSASSVLRNWKATADTGSYALTGAAANVLRAWRLSAGAGSYSITGSTASVLHGWRVAASAGSYAITGSNATLRRNLPLVAGIGSYTLTGTAASLLHRANVAAGAGSYNLAGTAATLRQNRNVTAGAGSFALTGSASTLSLLRKVIAESGIYLISGVDAALTTSSSKILAAGVGSYSIAGTSSNVVLLRKMIAESGIYLISGTGAGVVLSALDVVDTVTYSLHPVNCQMEGNAPDIKPGGMTIEWARGKAGTKVTASTSGPRRLSKTAPSFTVRTKQGVILD